MLIPNLNINSLDEIAKLVLNWDKSELQKYWQDKKFICYLHYIKDTNNELAKNTKKDNCQTEMISNHMEIGNLSDDEICPISFLIIMPLIDEAEILFLAVHEKNQRMGLARQLLHEACSYLGQRNIKKLFLEVKEDNHAVTFYEKYGFSKINIRKNYYGKKSAIIYKLNI